MIVLRQNNYSIQSGSPDKKGSASREILSWLKINGLPFGGLTLLNTAFGIGLKENLKVYGSAILMGVILRFAFTRGWKNSVNVSLDDIFTSTLFKIDDKVYKLRKYIVRNRDPKDYNVTFAFEEGKGVLLVKEDAKFELEELNKLLEDMVAENRNMSYESIKVGKNYVVAIVFPREYSLTEFISRMLRKLKEDVCFLTSKSIDEAINNYNEALDKKEKGFSRVVDVMSGELRRDPEAIKKWIYKAEEADCEFKRNGISEKEFISDLVVMKEDGDQIVYELKPKSRLIALGILPASYFWCFEKVKGGDGYEFSYSGD